MADMDDLYAEFVRDWQAGLAPDVDAFLQRAEPGERDAFAERVEAFVMVAPSVELQPDRAAAIEASPAFLRAVRIAEDPEPATWGARLRAGRRRAGLSLADLGARFARAFGIEGGEEKAARLLGRLEDGELAPAYVSGRASARLEELLGLAADALRPPQPQFRADDADPAGPPPEVAVAFAMAVDPGFDDWTGDELDLLLRGGG